LENTADKIHIVYFSGTGGTALAAKTLHDEFIARGVDARASEIFQNDMPHLQANEMLILMYPVYAADAPSPIFKWIASLEKSHGFATVIAVSGGGDISPNTACRVKPVKRLERKGVSVIGEYMICMPSNFILPTPNELAVKMIRILPKKCSIIADEIILKRPNRKKALLIDRIMLVFFETEKLGSKIFGKTLKADDKCNSCKLCAKICPRANINMADGRPKFGWQCVLCMRCVYSCPQKAIKAHLPILKNAVFKEGFDLKSIKNRAENDLLQDNEDKNLGGLWKGVAKYLADKRV